MLGSRTRSGLQAGAPARLSPAQCLLPSLLLTSDTTLQAESVLTRTGQPRVLSAQMWAQLCHISCRSESETLTWAGIQFLANILPQFVTSVQSRLESVLFSVHWPPEGVRGPWERVGGRVSPSTQAH